MSPTSASSPAPKALHVICGRDVGLFALILSTVPHISWALSEGRIPVVYYGRGNVYWTPRGYRDRDTVWEYYFEPLFPDYPAASIPQAVRELIDVKTQNEIFSFVADESTFISNDQTGGVRFNGESVKDHFDPSDALRQEVSEYVRRYIRPREYVNSIVNQFFDEKLANRYRIGVHIRGTDALVDRGRVLKENKLNFRRYFSVIERLIREHPDTVIFVASDSHASIDRIRERFGERVVACDFIRHEEGELAGKGPTGKIMPAYLAQDPEKAARNGEEAVVEYLLLCRCDHLVHNGSGLARTVLLSVPDLPSTNAFPTILFWYRVFKRWRRGTRVWRWAAGHYSAIQASLGRIASRSRSLG